MKFEEFANKKRDICVVGLGYVGLPLAILLSKKFKVVGFDVNHGRIEKLKEGIDVTNEVSREELLNSNVNFTSDERDLKKCDLIIVAVPTPVDKLKDPDLTFIRNASKIVGRNLRKNAIVVYESTVWPGLTEEVCVPILEKESGLKWKKDFFVGYSPERVNPGDKEHTIDKIVKIVAGDTPFTTKLLADIYGSVIKAGVYTAPDIKTAEAAKVIENIQRDINIALMNELALIFHKIGVDTKEVLKAASTKWNFLTFEPGLVGGHCIGVDPYYLAHKAKQAGYIPKLILAGRSINEEIPRYVAQETIKLLIKSKKNVSSAKILILGFSFKENVPDVRNTKVFDIIKELRDYGINVIVHDPIADKEDTLEEYKLKLVDNYEKFAPFDTITIAVKHKIFIDKLTLKHLSDISTEPPIIVDVKGIFDTKKVEKSDIIYWRL